MIYLLITRPPDGPPDLFRSSRLMLPSMPVFQAQHWIYRCHAYTTIAGWLQLTDAEELDGYWDAAPSRVLTATPHLSIAMGPGWTVAVLNHGVGVPDAGE